MGLTEPWSLAILDTYFLSALASSSGSIAHRHRLEAIPGALLRLRQTTAPEDTGTVDAPPFRLGPHGDIWPWFRHVPKQTMEPQGITR